MSVISSHVIAILRRAFPFLLFITLPAWAQPSTRMANPEAALPSSWTLQAALGRAFEYNADLLAAKHEFERQQGLRVQFLARLLPSVSLQGSLNERESALVDLSPSQR